MTEADAGEVKPPEFTEGVVNGTIWSDRQLYRSYRVRVRVTGPSRTYTLYGQLNHQMHTGKWSPGSAVETMIRILKQPNQD